jgi:hypothetical protein
MSDSDPGLGAASGYEIRTQGRISERWSGWFDGFEVSHEPDGTTLIRSSALDQAALHGLLAKIRDLGIPLVSVVRTPARHPGPEADGPDGG